MGDLPVSFLAGWIGWCQWMGTGVERRKTHLLELGCESDSLEGGCTQEPLIIIEVTFARAILLVLLR